MLFSWNLLVFVEFLPLFLKDFKQHLCEVYLDATMLSQLLQKYRFKLKEYFLLFANPTSVYLVFLLSLQICAALLFSCITPFFIRNLILPSSPSNEIPLNLIFSTCNYELHGICSFPTATLDYEKNIISVFDGDVLTKQYARSAYIKEASMFTKVLWVMFFPLYFAGFFYDYQSMELVLTNEHIESYDRLSTRLTYALQDRFAQVDSASLVINARLGLIRHILYYWPITSFMLLFITTFCVCMVIILLYWGLRSFSFSSSEPSLGTVENLDQITSTQNAFTTSKHGKKKMKIQEQYENSSNEYIPDNIDELPVCPILEGIPGWNTDTAVAGIAKCSINSNSSSGYISNGNGNFSKSTSRLGFETFENVETFSESIRKRK